MKIPINKHEEIQHDKNIAELFESKASLLLKGKYTPEEAQKYLEDLYKKHNITKK